MKFEFAKVSGTLGFVALAMIASPFAVADDSGWYGGINVGRSKVKIDDARISSSLLGAGFATTSIADDNRDNGYKIFGGYQFNRNIALEAGFFDLGNFGFTATTLPAGTLTGDIKLRGLNLDLVGTLPLTEKFSAFGRVGMIYAEAKDSFSGTGLINVRNPNPSKRETNYKYGLGLQYALSESVAIRAEAERYRVNDAVGNKGDIDLVSVGLIYRFGGRTPAAAPRAAAPAPIAAAEPTPKAVAIAPTPLPPPRFEKYTLSATELLFAFDSSELGRPQPKLDEVANILGSNSGINNIVITGYTDRIGSSKYNQKLSERRAIAVKNYLVNKGIDTSRLQAEGKGEANPVVVCTEKKHAALIKCLEPNRRVEIEQITIERRVQ